MSGAPKDHGTRAEWLEARRKIIGASDVPAILGVSPFRRTPLHVYLDKIGLAEDDGAGEENEAFYWGHALEAPIRKRYSEVTKRTLADTGEFTITHNSDLPEWCAATLDGSIVEADGKVTPAPLELKTIGGNPRAVLADWRDHGPPLAYAVQVQYQMLVTGASWASIAALIAGQRFVYADLERNDTLLKMILLKCEMFWRRVQQRNPPEPTGPDERVALKQLYQQETPGVAIALPERFVEVDARRRDAIERAKAADIERATCDNIIMASMGEAEVATLPDGTVYTWKSRETKGYEVKASTRRWLMRRGERE